MMAEFGPRTHHRACQDHAPMSHSRKAGNGRLGMNDSFEPFQSHAGAAEDFRLAPKAGRRADAIDKNAIRIPCRLRERPKDAYTAQLVAMRSGIVIQKSGD